MDDHVPADDPYDAFRRKQSLLSIPMSMRNSDCDFKFQVAHTSIEIKTHKRLLLHHATAFQKIIDDECDGPGRYTGGMTRLWCDDEVCIYWDGLEIIVESLYTRNRDYSDHVYLSETGSLRRDVVVWLGADAFGFKNFEAMAKLEFVKHCDQLCFDNRLEAASCRNVIEFCESFDSVTSEIPGAKFFPAQLAKKLCQLNLAGSMLSVIEDRLQDHCEYSISEQEGGWHTVKQTAQKLIGEALSKPRNYTSKKTSGIHFPIAWKAKFCDIKLLDISTGSEIDTHKVLLAYHSPILADRIQDDCRKGDDGVDALYFKSEEEVPWIGMQIVLQALYIDEEGIRGGDSKSSWPHEDFAAWLNATKYQIADVAAWAKQEFVKHCDAIDFEGDAEKKTVDGHRLDEFALLWCHGRYEEENIGAGFFRDYMIHTIARLNRKNFNLPVVKGILKHNPDWAVELASYLKNNEGSY